MARKSIGLNNITLAVIVISLVAIAIHFHRLSVGYKSDETSVKPIIINAQPDFAKQSSHDLRRGEAISPIFNDGPERRNPYVNGGGIGDNAGFPFSVSTQGETSYSLIGFLNRPATETDEAMRLPLYGRPTYSGSNKWDYYTKDDSRNVVVIPIDTNNDKELLDGDTTNVQTYEGSFTTNLYDVQTPRYLPNVY